MNSKGLQLEANLFLVPRVYARVRSISPPLKAAADDDDLKDWGVVRIDLMDAGSPIREHRRRRVNFGTEISSLPSKLLSLCALEFIEWSRFPITFGAATATRRRLPSWKLDLPDTAERIISSAGSRHLGNDIQLNWGML